MITCFAHGFIAEKPAVEMVGAGSCKCEFNVLWSRSVKRGGSWDTVWERATFVAWNDEAERVASRLDKGSRVTCTGTQETHSWDDQSGRKRYITKYRLTSWSVEPQRQQPSEGRSSGARAPQQDRQSSGSYRPAGRVEGQRYQEPSHHPDDDGFHEDHHDPQGGGRPVRPPNDGDDFITM
jgi:single-stranded DNA-binding protein